MKDGEVLSANGSRWVGTGLRMFYILATLAILSMVLSGAKKILKSNLWLKGSPEVNAGSMADIAFLLLIFFLVTTTIETDSGLNKLPPMEDQVDPPIIREKNIFTVLVSKNDQLLVEEELADIADLRSLAIAFLDNGGGVGDEACEYCQGERDEASSDNPDKAIISLKNDRETSYAVYIAVQMNWSQPTMIYEIVNLKDYLEPN